MTNKKNVEEEARKIIESAKKHNIPMKKKSKKK